MDRLYKKLEEYGKSDYYPFHMPGHKRNMDSSAASLLQKFMGLIIFIMQKA